MWIEPLSLSLSRGKKLTSLARSRNESGFSLIPGVIGVASGWKSPFVFSGESGEGTVPYFKFGSWGGIRKGVILRSDGFDFVRR